MIDEMIGVLLCPPCEPCRLTKAPVLFPLTHSTLCIGGSLGSGEGICGAMMTCGCCYFAGLVHTAAA